MDAYLPKPLRARDLYDSLDLVSTMRPGTSGSTAPAAAGSRPGLLDRATLIANFGGKPALLREVIDVFLGDSEALVEATLRAAERRDGRALTGAAHRLKGSVGLFSQGSAWSVAERLEKQGTSGDLAGIEQVSAELKSAMADVRGQLKALRDTL
jgi:HPt (histidine-containing phosphotransfer) domain-containing protein